MNKQEVIDTFLPQIIKDGYFEAYPTEDCLLLTADGQVFLKADENWAQRHAKAIAGANQEPEVFEIPRSAATPTTGKTQKGK